MKSNKNNLVLLPIAIAVSIVIGITIGGKFSNSGGIHFSDRKINTILNLVSDGYVDTVNINNIVEIQAMRRESQSRRFFSPHSHLLRTFFIF